VRYSAAGRMVFTVLGAAAELERGLIAERVRAGIPNARAKGKRAGQIKRLDFIGYLFRPSVAEPKDPLRAYSRQTPD
jgi:DNA invertase Pin-like site-specific DNA recombinase